MPFFPLKETKTEILKLKQTNKDQSNKIAEFRDKKEELMKIVENKVYGILGMLYLDFHFIILVYFCSKNELIKLSTNQIAMLENNLANLMEFVNKPAQKPLPTVHQASDNNNDHNEKENQTSKQNQAAVNLNNEAMLSSVLQVGFG
jgi:hypothetical protein